MRFELQQRFAAPVADVADAFCDPAFYALLADAPKLGQPEVLSREANGDRVVLRVRYRFTGDLSSAARAVLDPAKLTWVEESTHDLAAHDVTFVLHPDHYADRFTCRGQYRFELDRRNPKGTLRHAEGEVRVRAPLVGGAVERAIVSGLQEHSADGSRCWSASSRPEVFGYAGLRSGVRVGRLAPRAGGGSDQDRWR